MWSLSSAGAAWFSFLRVRWPRVLRSTKGGVLMQSDGRQARGDAAVSPVIAVILMVAITVVLAAVVYAWVSGFGGENAETPGTLALQSVDASAPDYGFIVTSAAGIDWSDLGVLTSEAFEYGDAAGEWCAERDGACLVDPEGVQVQAGDVLRVYGAAAGDDLRVVDEPANALLVTLTLR